MDSTVQLKLFMYGILNNSICLFGLSGNFLLLYIFILYKDMRKQSINIYLTVLALYDNGVLIFSILMLNLPAITDYQQLAISGPLMVPANTSLHVLQTPIFSPGSPFPGAASTYRHLYYQTTVPVLTYKTSRPPDLTIPTKTPLDTGQADPSEYSTSHQRSWPPSAPTATAFSPTASPLGIVPSTFSAVTAATVLTSMPFNGQSSQASSPSSPVVSTSADSFTHPIRHQSTSAAPNYNIHHRKRTKRTPKVNSTSSRLFTPQLRNIFHSCFNLTSDDLEKLKHNMILLNTSAKFEPTPLDVSTEPLEVVEQLFFEALVRQLILWLRLSLQTKLSATFGQSSTALPFHGEVSSESLHPSAITDLVQCRHSLLQYYRSEMPQSDQSTTTSNATGEVNTPELNAVFDGQPDVTSTSRRSQLSDDEATSVSLLALDTLKDIYQLSASGAASTLYPDNLFYADSLTGQGNSIDVNETRSENAYNVEVEAGIEGDYQPPPPGSLYPLMYYVKVVYPLALISQTGSIWTTCLITIERYLAVCHPLMSLTLSTRSRAIWALCILSAAALLFNLPRFAEVDTTGDNIRPSELRRNQIYYYVYYICLNLSLNYILPLSLLSALNIKIYASVRHANAHRNELTRARQSELHLASMLVLIVAIFIACNAPAFLVNCMEPYFDAGNPLLEAITIFSNVLVCFNSAINFVIYCIFGKKFRSKLKQVLGLRGSACLIRSGSARNLHARNRYFSRRFSTANSSFKLTMATHLQNANGPTNGNHVGGNQPRQYSYPHTALPAVMASPVNGNDAQQNGSTEECTKGKPRSASAGVTNLIPLNLQMNGDSRGAGAGNHYSSGPTADQNANHFYSDTSITLNTFV